MPASTRNRLRRNALDWRPGAVRKVEASGADPRAVAAALRKLAACTRRCPVPEIAVNHESYGVGLTLKSTMMHFVIEPDGLVYIVL